MFIRRRNEQERSRQRRQSQRKHRQAGKLIISVDDSGDKTEEENIVGEFQGLLIILLEKEMICLFIFTIINLHMDQICWLENMAEALLQYYPVI